MDTISTTSLLLFLLLYFMIGIGAALEKIFQAIGVRDNGLLVFLNIVTALFIIFFWPIKVGWIIAKM